MILSLNASFGDIITHYYLSPRGVARYRFHPVCVCVCLSVCPANILVFHLSAMIRDIDLKCIQDTYMVELNSHNKFYEGQDHRDGTLLYEGIHVYHKI